MKIHHYTLTIPTKVPPTAIAKPSRLVRIFRSVWPVSPVWAWYTRTIESDHEIRRSDDVRIGGVKVHVDARPYLTGSDEQPEGKMELECAPHYIGSGLHLNFDPQDALQHCKELEDAGFVRVRC
jgi:hypothetical protein